MSWNTHIPKFRRFVLQNFPFIEEDFDALTDYALICKVIEYLNQVINSQNDVVDNVEELNTAFTTLHDYVEHYFDNLDVQEEINNKLDAMAEAGTLQEIIGDYLNATAVWGFDTVADMKASTNLINGSYARTLGYNNKNDQGAALYKIRTITNDDIVDEKFILEMEDDSLIAELITEGTLSPEQIGCINDGVEDDATYIQDCINYSKDNGVKVVFGHETYFIKTAINIPSEYDIDFQGITLKAIDNTNLTKGMINIELTENLHNGVLSNINLNQNNLANKGIYINRSWRRVYENINIYNTPASGYGIYLDGTNGSAGGNQFNNITGTGRYRFSTFIYVGVNDCVFSHVDYQQYSTGIETNRFVRLYDVHGYVSNSWDEYDWYTDSIFIKLGSNSRILADNLYPDSVNYCFYNSSVLSSQIGQIFYTFSDTTEQNNVTSVMFKALNDNTEVFYRWRVGSINLSIANTVLFELMANSRTNLSSYLHLDSITGSGSITVANPPIFVNRVLPLDNFTKLGIYGKTLIAQGTCQYAGLTNPRDICKTDINSGYSLIDGYYSYKGINPDNNSVFDGTVKVENNIVSIQPNANQLANYQFFISLPVQEVTIGS